MQKIILTGGGSGGHIIPSIALLPELKKHFDKIYYIGESGKMEEKIALSHSIPFYPVKAIKFTRGKILRNLAIPFVLPVAIVRAKKILRQLQPDVVFSKGGYVSLPTALAAESLGIPVVVHESDGSLGLANKIASRRAHYVITTDKIDIENNVVLPNPIRSELFSGNREHIYKELNLRRDKRNILVLGGSLGAQAINNVIAECVERLIDKYNIIHLTGKGKATDIDMSGYYPVEYTDSIGDYYDTADLVISRAGAGVIQELIALGKRAILIPLPSDCSRGDQQTNAEKTPYKIIEQSDLSSDTLLCAIKETICSSPPPPHYDRATPRKIVDVILRAKDNI